MVELQPRLDMRSRGRKQFKIFTTSSWERLRTIVDFISFFKKTNSAETATFLLVVPHTNVMSGANISSYNIQTKSRF